MAIPSPPKILPRMVAPIVTVIKATIAENITGLLFSSPNNSDILMLIMAFGIRTKLIILITSISVKFGKNIGMKMGSDI